MSTAFVTARLPDRLRAELERLAAEHERSVSGELRVALAAHIERHDDPDQEGPSR